MKPSLLIVFVLAMLPAFAQQRVVVPENVYFADMHLKLTSGAQESIQKQVDYLLNYPSYFQQKVDRADTYFPIIERVFREEGIPEDFKYLVLQESGLVSDAVSTSNAVGFWQFKKEAASDFGLWVNTDIDERKHIVESSRGAAKYLKKHNDYYNNWVVSLLSYNLGFTGVKSTPEAKHAGKKTMPVEKDTHMYVQKFIAHKIAFENYVGKNSTPALTLQEYEVRGGGSLLDIAQATKVDIVELERYNKWLTSSSVPNNKTYTVLLPISQGTTPVMASTGAVATQQPVLPELAVAKPGTFVSLHGLKAIVAAPGDNKDKLALHAGISTRKFLRYNDLNSFDPIEPGQPYFVEEKRNAADVDFYISQPGESLQTIAQKHGVKERSVRIKNRMRRDEVLVAGRKLWMKKTRPRHTPAEYTRLSAAPKPQQQAVTKTAVVTTAAAPAPVTPTPQPVAQVAVAAQPVKTDTRVTEAPRTSTSKPLYGNLYARPASRKTADVSTEGQEEEEEPEYTLPEETADDSTPFDLSSLDEPTADASAAIKAKETVVKPEPVRAEPKPATPVPASSAPKPVAAAAPKPAAPAPAATPKPAAPAPVAAEPASAKVHIVAKGETVYSISRRYGLEAGQLQALNNLAGNSISIGQQLQVSGTPKQPVLAAATPVATPEPTAPAAGNANTHVVQQGETMYQIARKHNMTVIDLMELNSRTDTNLKPGEALVVKKK